MKPASFNLHRPSTIKDAVNLLSELADKDVRILAGGQSLVPMMAFRLAQPTDLIDISHIRDLTNLRDEKNYIDIGALVRHADLALASDRDIVRHILSMISHHIAHHPIRTRGTFCGSIAHADPSSEWCLAATTLDALITAQNKHTIRHIPAKDFFTGIMTNNLNADEIITSVRIPKIDKARYVFKEFSRRKGDFCLASVLIVADVDEHQRIIKIHLGIGGVETAPRRIKGAETLMMGQKLSADLCYAAADLIARDLDPMSDKTTSADYRRDLAHGLIIEALREIL